MSTINFCRNQGLGKYTPNWLKNQPWNLNPIKGREINGQFFTSQTMHLAMHGRSAKLDLKLFQKWNYGYSTGAKAFQISGGMRLLSSTDFEKTGDTTENVLIFDEKGQILKVDAQTGQILSRGSTTLAPFDHPFELPHPLE